MGVKRAFEFGLNVRLNTPMSNRKGVADMPDPDRPTRDRAALQRLLRRRGRQGKAGANPKTSIKSWAEYSEVNFTPSGDHSGLSRYWPLAGALGVLLFPAGLFLAGATMAPKIKLAEALVGTVQIFGATLGALFLASLFCFPLIILSKTLDGADARDRRKSSALADRIKTRREAKGPTDDDP